jgi:hypothetical protein
VNVQGWALATVVVGAIVGGAVRAIGWYVERIARRREERTKEDRNERAERERNDPTIQEIYTRQVQVLIEDFRQQLRDKDMEIARLKAELTASARRRSGDGPTRGEGPG